MNVPEALSATERAVGRFQKAVAEASEELAGELKNIHSQLLEEQPKEAVARARDKPVPFRRDYGKE